MKPAQQVSQRVVALNEEMPGTPPGVTVSVVDQTIRIRLCGHVSLCTSFEVMTHIAAEPSIGAGWPVLVDLRRLASAPPHTSDLRVFAGNLGTLRAQYSGKFAIVTATRLHYGLARMLSIYAEFKGITMTVFRDLDTAERWLHEPRSS